MALTTVTVSIDIEQCSGVPLPNAKVDFELTSIDISGAIVVPQRVSATCNANGIGSISLWANASGSQGSQYKVTAFDQYGGFVFSALATVPASNCNLHSILNLQAPAVVDDAQRAALDAQAYAAQAAVDLDAHINDTADAHGASAISLAPIGGMTATDVQAGIAELANISGVNTNLAATLSATNIVVTSDTGTDATLPAADGTNAGLMVPAQVAKLAGIAAGATANSADADLLARANHTGEQAIATVTGLQTALDAKQATLVSGTSIKTINSTSLLGAGDIAVVSTPSGSDTQVQFNDGGAFGGDAGLTYNKTTDALTSAGQITFTRAYNRATPVLTNGTGGIGFSSGNTHFSVAGAANFSIDNNGVMIAGGKALQWSSSHTDAASAFLNVYADAANTLAQRTTTNPQIFRVYNTYTDASNYERGKFGWNANVLEIGAEAATGTLRQTKLIGESIAFDAVAYPKQYTNATEPSFVNGGMFFNTDLDKLRIGGAAGWETVTSA